MSTAEQTPGQGGDDAGPDSIAITPHDLFVSYAHTDVAFAVRLREALGEHGKTAWVDESGIRPNERWRDALNRAVEQSSAVIFISSPDALKSSFCRAELDHAHQHGKRIISVAYRAVDMGAVPAEAADYQFIPARGCFDDAFPANLTLLLEAIDTDLEWLRATTRWEQKALEWDRAKRDDSFLLSGSELEDAESYLAAQSGHRPEPTPLQGEFALLSRRRQVARLRRTRAATTIALVIVSALAVLAIILRQQSVSNAHVATSRQFAAQGVAALSSDPNLSVLYAVRALAVDDTAQAEAALRRAAPAVQLLSTLTPGGTLTDAAYDGAGARVVTASNAGVATVYSTDGDRRLAVIREPSVGALGSQNFSTAGNGLTAAVLSGNGRLVATASLDTTARVWNADTGRQLAVFSAPQPQTLRDVAFNADASELVTADDGGRAEIYQPGAIAAGAHGVRAGRPRAGHRRLQRRRPPAADRLQRRDRPGLGREHRNPAADVHRAGRPAARRRRVQCRRAAHRHRQRRRHGPDLGRGLGPSAGGARLELGLEPPDRPLQPGRQRGRDGRQRPDRNGLGRRHR